MRYRVERWASAGMLASLAAAVFLGSGEMMVSAQQQSGNRSAEEAQGQRTIGLMEGRTAPSSFPRFEQASIANGQAVVVGATQGAAPQTTQAQACFTCHGLHGAGDGTGAFPRLSGQPAFYLYKQLVDYASGSRPNPIMSPIAKALTPAEMEDVAAYYAAQTGAHYFPAAPADPLLIQQGGALSAIGSAEKGIQACVNCHGPSGTGLAPSFPYLSGQYASYTELQLQLWQQGERKNDPLNVMADIARRMAPEDIRAVAAYFAAMRPPGVDPKNVAGAAGASLPPAASPQQPASGATR